MGLLLAAGCGAPSESAEDPPTHKEPGDEAAGSESGGPDGSVGEGEGEGEPAPAPEEDLPQAERPEMRDWVCPPRWLPTPVGEGTDWGFNACRPPPGVEGGCAGATAQFPGDSRCVPLGTECAGERAPASDEELRRLSGLGDEAIIVHAPPGPIGGLLASIGQAPTIMALTQHVYSGGLNIPDGANVAFVGGCVEGTRLTSEGTGDFALRVTGGRRVVLSNLKVTPGSWGLRVLADGALTLRDVVMDGIEGGAAVGVVGAGELNLDRVAIRNTQRFGDKLGGAVIGLAGSQVRGIDVEIDGGAGLGVMMDGEGDGQPGGPLARAEFERLAIRRIELSLSVAEAERILPPPEIGAVVALGRGHIDAQQVVLEHCAGIGLQAGRYGGGDGIAVMSVRDVVVDHQTAGELHRWGWAVSARRGGQLTVERLLAESYQEAAIVATGSERLGPGVLHMTDVAVRDGRPTRPSRVGFGLAVFGGAEITGERVAIHRALGWGISVAPSLPDPRVTLTDLVISETRDPGPTGIRAGAADGGGVLSEGWNQLTFRRTLIQDVGAFGIALIGSNLMAEHLTVDGVAEDPCGEISDLLAGGCLHDGQIRYSGGTGLLAAQGATVEVGAFELIGGALAGLQIASNSVVTATSGVIHDNSIGINAPPPADPVNWFEDVYVFDNVQDVTREALPVPELEIGFMSDG